MKIGILTFHNADNYGAVLQCYALQKSISENFPEHKVFIVNHKNNLIESAYAVFPFAWDKTRSLIGNILTLFSVCAMIPARRKARKEFFVFRAENFNLGDANLSDYDIVIFGSDQIWNTRLIGSDRTFFGSDYNGIKIAYGASDGGELLIEENVKLDLKGFKSISCRESSFSERLKREADIIAKTVCDPVFLLSENQWKKKSLLPKENGYVLVFKIQQNENLDSVAKSIGEKLNKKIIQIFYACSVKQFFIASGKKRITISPKQFVGYFANAAFVLTTSFHGTAFSIVFEKPFYTLCMAKGKERVIDLLNRIGLRDRYIMQVNNNQTLSEDIYTEAVKQKIADYIQDSKDWINKTIAEFTGGGYKCIVIHCFTSSLSHTSAQGCVA